MASGDALGEASASASQKGNPETHDDLLREVHFEENDLPMFNLQGELLGDEVHIEENDQPMLDFRGDSTQSYHTPPVAVMVNPQASKVPTIKIEALEGPFISELTVNTIDDPIEISDTEDLDHTCEHDFKMLDGVVPSDKEVLEEITILDAESTPVPIKKEDDEVEFLWEKMDDRVIELDSDDEPSTASQPNLGKSFLKGLDPEGKRRSIDSAAMRRAQEAHLQVLRRRHGIPEPSATRGILPGLGLQGPKSGDDFVWMQEVVNLDDGPLTDFRAVKQEYKAKRKARKNTMEDDVQYKKAHMENSQRVKRLAQEAADTDSDDEAEESDDGLFVSQQRYSHSKRPFSSMMDVNDDDDDDDDDDEGVVPVEKPNSKRPKTVQANISTKKSRARALQKELKSNMLAGIEPHLLRDQKRVEDRRAAEAETVHTGGKKSSKKSKAPDLSAKRTKTGRMNNIGSLVTSNLYEDSNANLDRQALPVVTEKKKKEFLSSLIANIPLEDKKQANADRIDVLRASALLGSRKVFPDGQGNWTFKGMKSSLYHYQLSGAAYMKMREQGEQNPYGGILADEMGLGKTVMMIACMLANRQTDPEEPKCTLIVCSPALIGQCESWRHTYADGA